MFFGASIHHRKTPSSGRKTSFLATASYSEDFVFLKRRTLTKKMLKIAFARNSSDKEGVFDLRETFFHEIDFRRSKHENTNLRISLEMPATASIMKHEFAKFEQKFVPLQQCDRCNFLYLLDDVGVSDQFQRDVDNILQDQSVGTYELLYDALTKKSQCNRSCFELLAVHCIFNFLASTDDNDPTVPQTHTGGRFR
jgi:hypothetical protein